MGLGDFLVGKRVGPDPVAFDVREAAQDALAAQRESLQGLRTLSKKSGDVAKGIFGRKKAVVAQNRADTIRGLRDKLARTGRAGTSLELAARLGAEKEAGQQALNVQAEQPLMEQQLRTQGLQNLLGAGLQVGQQNKVPIRFRKTRQGGSLTTLATIGGAAAGVAAGNPMMGAQIGQSIGSGVQGSFQ